MKFILKTDEHFILHKGESVINVDEVISEVGGKADASDLSTVATSGSYNDLIDKPTLLPASDVYSWAKASTKPSYTLDEVTDGSTRKLSDYLKKEDISAWAKASTKPTYTPSEIGLGNVGNFKAVSTVASLGLTSTELANARANIGAGTSSLTLGNGSSNAYYGDKGKIAYDHSQTLHARTDATKVEASSTNGNIKINGTETTVYTPPSGTNPHGTTKSDVGLGNVTNDSQVKRTEMGTANGVATLGSDGKVLSSQLPSYVDDVVDLLNIASLAPSTCKVGDMYYNTSSNKIFTATAINTWGTTGTTPESGKIYINITNGKTYRWSGTTLGVISETLALGETSSTAYRGDRGKIAYDHSLTAHTKVEASSTNGNIKINGTETTVYTHPSGTNPHGTTKSDVGLGNVGNFKAVSTVASQGLTDTEKSNARANIGAGTSSFSGSYNDLSNKPTLFSGSYNDLTNKPTIPSAANNGTFSIKTKVGSNTAVVASDFTANQSSADDITFIQGSNVTLTTDATNRTITISSTNTTYSAATTSAAGLMSAADKTKLDGIATGATAVSSSTVSGWGFTKNAGTVTQVKVGTTAYDPSSGIVSLPAYPTTLPASDVYSWAKASSKPSYAWSEITGKPSTFTPASHEHSYITALANYAFTASTLPNSLALGVSAGFVALNSGFGNYGSVLNVITYSGGGGSLLLYAPYSPTYGGTRLKARFGNYEVSSGNSWTDLKEIAWLSDVPTNTNQLTNGAGFITSSGSCAYATSAGSADNATNADKFGNVLPSGYKTRIVSDTRKHDSGWYRILTCNGSNNHSTAFFITFFGLYHYVKPTPITFLINASYQSITIRQIGANPQYGFIKRIRAISESGIKFHIDVKFENGAESVAASSNEISFEILPLDPHARDYISIADYSLITDSVTPAAEVECKTYFASDAAGVLETARTLWGQSFNGSANVSGAMSGVTNIDSLLYFDTTNSRIGIGTSTPANKLDVSGYIGCYEGFIFSRPNWNYISVPATNGNLAFNVGNAGLGANTKMCLLNNGNVGIGTTIPAYKLDVNGTLNASGNITQNGVGVLTKDGGQLTPLSTLTFVDNAATVLQQKSLTISYSGITVPNEAVVLGSIGKVFASDGSRVSYGNNSNNIPYSNGTVCTNLNADMLDGKHASEFVPIDGNGNARLNSINDMLLFEGSLVNIGDDYNADVTISGVCNILDTLTTVSIEPSTDNEYVIGDTNKRFAAIYSRVLVAYGTASACHVGTSSTNRLSLHWTADNERGLYDATDNWLIATDGTNTRLMFGKVGIGVASPTQQLHVNGRILADRTGYSTTMQVQLDPINIETKLIRGSNSAYFRLASNEAQYNTTIGGHHFKQAITCDSSVTATSHPTSSDERLKDIVDDNASLSIDDIANAPAVHFQWKNEDLEEGQWKETHVGTIAQYWQEIIPECVHQDGEYLTMQYDTIALLAAISLARKNKELEQRILSLETQLQELKS